MTNEDLAARIRAGDDKGMKNTLCLWKQNSGIIHKTISRYAGYVELEDLEQESFFAVHKAALSYDPAAGTAFTSVLTLYLKCICGRYAANHRAAVRIPQFELNRIRKYKQFVSSYYATTGRDPADSTIMSVLGISKKQLESLRKDLPCVNPASLDAPLPGDPDGEAFTLADMIQDKGADVEGQAASALFDRERRRAVWGAVDALGAKDAAAIRARYLGGGMTYQEIADAEGITPQRVRARVQHGMSELRRRHGKTLREYYPRNAIFSRAITGTGTGVFKRTGESATERAAFWALEFMDEWRRDYYAAPSADVTAAMPAGKAGNH